uniref:Transforming growth factor beta mimic 7 n=1 Tax=Heligmosomoides polygyrus bakeri TaxID=375939 RepID=A0A2P1IQ85_HELBE|nr:transforming growth factor beta mimic 7 [Heligmosomoides bakeri]
MLLIVVIGLLEASAAGDNSCMPLSEETDTYQYFAQTSNKEETPARKDSSGMYPEYTHVKRFCKGLHGEDKTGEFIGLCHRSEWVYYMGVQECRDRRCSPLSESDTVSYEYRKATLNSSRISYDTSANPDDSGKYPELTYIRRICKNFPANSKVRGVIVGMCYNAEWRFSSAPVCPPYGCPPIQDNDKFRHEYYEYAGSRDVVGQAVTKDSSGNYPPQTHARRHCQARSVKVDQGELVAICHERSDTGESRWVYYHNIKQCPVPGCTITYKANSTVTYKYLQYTMSPDQTVVAKEATPQSGEYPDGTFAIVICKIPTRIGEKTGTIIAQCSNRQWKPEKYQIIPECPGRECAPLTDNDTVRYEYLNISRTGYYTLSTSTVKPRSGKYPERTSAKMFCKKATGDNKNLGEIAGRCSKGEWVKENEATVLQCPILGCLPLAENDTVEYKYFKSEQTSNDFANIAVLDWSGKFAVGSYARRICKKLDVNSRAQGDISKCGANGWVHRNTWPCPPQGSCNINEVYLDLKFTSTIVDTRLAVAVYKKPDTVSTFYGPGSKIQALCKGNPADLECFEGGWQGRRHAENERKFAKIRCTDSGVTYDE